MSCHTASSRCSSPPLDAGSSIAAQKDPSLSTVRPPLNAACPAAACSKTRVSVATSVSNWAPRSSQGDSGSHACAMLRLPLVDRMLRRLRAEPEMAASSEARTEPLVPSLRRSGCMLTRGEAHAVMVAPSGSLRRSGAEAPRSRNEMTLGPLSRSRTEAVVSSLYCSGAPRSGCMIAPSEAHTEAGVSLCRSGVEAHRDRVVGFGLCISVEERRRELRLSSDEGSAGPL